MKECLTGLIGLSELDCECFTIEDAALKQSSMGLFVDDLEGIDLQLIQNALGCGETLETNFNRMYKSATTFFESDLQVAISESFRQHYKPYQGRVGEKKYDQPRPSMPIMGLKLDTMHVDGAAIVIKSVDLYFASAGTITLKVYKNEEHLADYDEEITLSQGKTHHDYPTPINLPLVEDGIKNEYLIVYESNGLQPMNNKASCGCASVESIRKHFLKPVGVKGTDIYNLQTDNTYAFGLSLNIIASCSIDNMICDWTLDDTFYRRAAMALWYKMGVLTIESLFGSREINFDTFSDREYLYTRKKKFESNYKNIITWLSENTTINQSACFVCNTDKKATMGRILT